MDFVVPRDGRWKATLPGFKSIVGLLAVITLHVIVASPMASAQETPILVAPDVPEIGGWCGDRAVYFNGGTQILDVFSKKQVRLKFNRSKYSISRCSPNGRWAIVTRIGTRAEPTEIALWDLLQGSPQEVGRGYVDFSWSPDGKIVLYRFVPMRGYEKDPANSIRFPATGRDFRAVSTLDLISNSPRQRQAKSGPDRRNGLVCAGWVCRSAAG